MLHFCPTPFLWGLDNSLTPLFVGGSQEACTHWASRMAGVWMLTSPCFPRAKGAAPSHSCCITAASGSPEVWETSTPMALGHAAAAQPRLSPASVGCGSPARKGRAAGKRPWLGVITEQLSKQEHGASFPLRPESEVPLPGLYACLSRRAMGKQARADCWQ